MPPGREGREPPQAAARARTAGLSVAALTSFADVDGGHICGAQALPACQILRPGVAVERVRRVVRQGNKHAFFFVVGACACGHHVDAREQLGSRVSGLVRACIQNRHGRACARTAPRGWIQQTQQQVRDEGDARLHTDLLGPARPHQVVLARVPQHGQRGGDTYACTHEQRGRCGVRRGVAPHAETTGAASYRRRTFLAHEVVMQHVVGPHSGARC